MWKYATYPFRNFYKGASHKTSITVVFCTNKGGIRAKPKKITPYGASAKFTPLI